VRREKREIDDPDVSREPSLVCYSGKISIKEQRDEIEFYGFVISFFSRLSTPFA
jgi:hypothetical protein